MLVTLLGATVTNFGQEVGYQETNETNKRTIEGIQNK